MADRPIPVLIQVRIPTTNMQSENDAIDMSIPGTCEVYRKEDVDAYIADLEQQLKEKDTEIKKLRSKLAPKEPLRAPYGLNPKLMDRVGPAGPVSPFDED